MYEDKRKMLFNKIGEINPIFNQLNSHQKFVYLMTNTKEQQVTWIAKFVHDAMYERAVYHLQDN